MRTNEELPVRCSLGPSRLLGLTGVTVIQAFCVAGVCSELLITVRETIAPKPRSEPVLSLNGERPADRVRPVKFNT